MLGTEIYVERTYALKPEIYPEAQRTFYILSSLVEHWNVTGIAPLPNWYITTYTFYIVLCTVMYENRA